MLKKEEHNTKYGSSSGSKTFLKVMFVHSNILLWLSSSKSLLV